VGTAVGIAVPLLHGADPAPAGQQPLRLAPVPGGLVLAGTF